MSLKVNFCLIVFTLTAQFYFGQNYDIDSNDVFKKTDEEYIDLVIKRGQNSDKEIVMKTAQITQRGFKNVFTNNYYNPTISYSAQINPYAENYMRQYLVNNQRELTKMKSWSAPYFNLIDGILVQYGLPKELKYVAVIESHLNPKTTSWAGAAGPWQFMPITAREYGLQVNNFIDERRDYFKSTHAAAKYLLSLYKQMNDWLLVLASYNGGPGRVQYAIKKSGSRNFWDLQHYLPTESKNYVKKFLATHYIMEGESSGGQFIDNVANKAPFNDVLEPSKQIVAPNPKKIDIVKKKEIKFSDRNIETTEVEGRFVGLVIAKNLTMDINHFSQLNPNFDDEIQQNGKTKLSLPQNLMRVFTQNKSLILNECIQILISGGNEKYSEKNVEENKKRFSPVLPQKSKSKKTMRFAAPRQ